MKHRRWIIALLCTVAFLFSCVPQSAQIEGTWEFVGYKAERVESIIELDSTICFDGDGNGFYYLNEDSSRLHRFSYLLSNDSKLAIIIDGETSVVGYSIDLKTKRLTLDGLEYRLISTEMKKLVEQASPSSTSTPTPTPTPTPTNPYVSVSVGDIITFGKYEQDNNFSNGPEPLQWIVLRKDGSSLLVITEKVIDCKPFNTQYCKLRWRSCDLRAWLNGDFMDSAFSYAERQMISETSVADAGNTDKGIGPGKSTVDSIFLLSKEEAAKWFDSDGTRLAKPTKYAIHQGILTNDNGYCWWWLRNPGVDLDHASVISPTGSIYSSGDRVSRKDWGVRPVMWIDIGS